MTISFPQKKPSTAPLLRAKRLAADHLNPLQARITKQTHRNPGQLPQPDATKCDQIRRPTQNAPFHPPILTPNPQPSEHLELIPLKTELRLRLVDRHLVM